MISSTASRPPARAVAVAGVLVAVVLGALLLLWAKWLPYGARIGDL
jgi:high-affinity Fe2+/Pb2+ permease